MSEPAPLFTIQILRVFIHVMNEFQELTGISDSALAGYVGIGRDTLRALKTWDGTGQSPNAGTMLTIDEFLRLNFDSSSISSSEKIYRQTIAAAIKAQGYDGGRFEKPET